MSFWVPLLLDEPGAAGVVVDGDPVVAGFDVTDQSALLGGIDTEQSVAGFANQADPILELPIPIGGVTRLPVVDGFWVPPDQPENPWPFIPSANGARSAAITVPGYPNATQIDVQPQMNGPGSGSFTLPLPASGPNENELVGIEVGGVRQLTGHCETVADTIVTQSEEQGEERRVTVTGLLGNEWSVALVLPDFGAQDITRLGEPVQDERVFDWTMNGIGTDDPDDVDPTNVISSHSIGIADGANNGAFPLPDVWPDGEARWMWARPLLAQQPQGYCHFRVPFSATPGKAQVWAATTDNCQVWIDGVKMLVCDTAYASQHVEIEFKGKYHLATIFAYNLSGRSGVLFTAMPVRSDGTFGPPHMNSRSNWKCLAYPKRSFRLNPGQVLRRLQFEARRRRVAYIPDWVFTFNSSHDSAGRPWPPNDPITLEVGMSMLDVLDRLAEDLIDYVAAPSGRILHAYVKGKGTGRDVDLPWTAGVDLTDHEQERTIRQWS